MTETKQPTDIEILDDIIKEHRKEIDKLKKRVVGNYTLYSDTDATYRDIRRHEDLIQIAKERQDYIRREQYYIMKQKELEEKRRKEQEREKIKTKTVHTQNYDSNMLISNSKLVNITKTQPIKKKSRVVTDVHKYMKKKTECEKTFLTLTKPIINKSVEKLKYVKNYLWDWIVYILKYIGYSTGILKKV